VPLLVVGTLAYDTVETPAGRAEEVLGGAATYFAVAASFFCDVRLVGVVGEDFRAEDRSLLEGRGIDLAGLSVAPGASFRWSGSYIEDLNVAETRATHLNVLEGYEPRLPEGFRDSAFVFLANAPPALQAMVLDQVGKQAFVAADTMNLWIDTAREELLGLLRRVDLLICNDQEAVSISGQENLIRAGRALLELGPRYAIIKKGEHGAMLFGASMFYAIPAYPVPEVVDPTGAGDSFAGGVMGSLAGAGAGASSERELRRAMIRGSVVASFTVEAFSLGRLGRLTRGELDRRSETFLTCFAQP